MLLDENESINFINETLNEGYYCSQNEMSSTSLKLSVYIKCLEFAYQEGLLKEELASFLCFFNELLNELISTNEGKLFMAKHTNLFSEKC